MKPTTTPGGAQLIWLEAGDTLQNGDIYEDTLGAHVVQSTYPSSMEPGQILDFSVVGYTRPRRYIPLSPTT